jgi:hypothetical protein
MGILARGEYKAFDKFGYASLDHLSSLDQVHQ